MLHVVSLVIFRLNTILNIKYDYNHDLLNAYSIVENGLCKYNDYGDSSHLLHAEHNVRFIIFYLLK